jgi:FAD/FMN-containing dehydrogenase
VEGGATAGDLLAAARSSGLAPVTGTVKSVGMAGLTLAGGYGPLNGKCGLALDNLLGAEVVLADGRRVTADGRENADLYWALRGGGGNFGVVTSLRYRLHPMGSVLCGLVLFSASDALGVLRGYRELVASAPDELTMMTGFLPGPDGQPMLFLFPTWSGDRAGGEAVVSMLNDLGTPLSSKVGAMAYEDVLGMFDAQVVNGRHYELQTRWIAEMTDDTAAMLLEGARAITSPFSAIAVHHFHGASTRVPVAETAFGLRRDHLLVEILAAWESSSSDGGTVYRQWARALDRKMETLALPGGYPNLLGTEERERVRLAYGPNFARLMELKRRFDPENVFASATPTLPANA